MSGGAYVPAPQARLVRHCAIHTRREWSTCSPCRPRRAARASRARPTVCAAVETNRNVDTKTSTSPADALRAAMKAFASKEQDAPLEQLLHPECVWQGPLGDISGQREIVARLRELRNYVIDASFYAPDSGTRDDGFEWVASATWPYPHRPRLIAAGDVDIDIDARGRITRVHSVWFARPRDVWLRQAPPRWEDIYWAYAAPHCEDNAALRRVLRKSKSFEIVEESAYEAWEVVLCSPEEDAKYEGLEDYYKAPLAPEYAYGGSLRKRESYQAARPICLRRRDDGELLWSTPIPTRFWELPLREGVDARVRQRAVPRRTVAVRTIYGAPSSTKVEQELEKLVSDLRADGVLGENVQLPAESLLFYHYSNKQGFDNSGIFCIASFYGTPLQRRRNEIAVVLPPGSVAV